MAATMQVDEKMEVKPPYDIDDDRAWDLINSVYCIGGTFEQWVSSDDGAAAKALECVKTLEIGQLVVDLALESVWTAFRREIVPLFWSSVCSPQCTNRAMPDTDILTRFHDALQLLQNSVVVLSPLIQRCEEVCRECGVQFRGISDTGSMEKEMIIQLRATLHSQMPYSAPKTLKAIYGVAFNIFTQLHLCHLESEEDKDVTDEMCQGCSCSKLDCKCQAFLTMVRDINKVTWRVGVANELCGAVASGTLMQAVQRKVQEMCELPHDTPRLLALNKWVEDASLGWLSFISSPEGSTPDTCHPLYRTCHNLMIRTFIYTRINNLFTIVIDFPESRPAIEDLRSCLQHVDVHRHLVQTLKSNIERRLLHPGVLTENVLHAYISIIRALKLLEPRGVILDLVTEPVRSYLRGRRDLVRYIVTRLTDGSGLELSEDLVTDPDPEGLDGSTSMLPPDSRGVEAPPAELEWRDWMPDTIYARPRAPGETDGGIKKNSKELSNNELISMLVDIYGSKDMFISEYRAIFADRLLCTIDCSKTSVATETMNLEHIKKRFGYNSPYINKIEVMIRDMNDSRFMNKVVEEQLSQQKEGYHGPQLGCLTVSNLFWPSFKEETFKLPEQAQEYLDRYDGIYKETHRNKVLQWKHHLGQVELELEFENRKLDLKVNPGQAAVIMMFEKNPRWTLDEIALEINTTSLTARKYLSFWASQNVVKEVSQDVFELIENLDSSSANDSSLSQLPMITSGPDYETESAMASSDAQREEELMGLWLYIQGMLTNLESLSLERIHSMLLTFFVDDGGDCTVDELKRLLDEKVSQHQLMCVNGEYKLNKS